MPFFFRCYQFSEQHCGAADVCEVQGAPYCHQLHYNQPGLYRHWSGWHWLSHVSCLRHPWQLEIWLHWLSGGWNEECHCVISLVKHHTSKHKNVNMRDFVCLVALYSFKIFICMPYIFSLYSLLASVIAKSHRNYCHSLLTDWSGHNR